MNWKSISDVDLPAEGDEVGGWFGVFDPQWEVRPFKWPKWPMPSSSKLKPEIIHEGCKIAGWTHFRPMNAPPRAFDKDEARAKIGKWVIS